MESDELGNIHRQLQRQQVTNNHRAEGKLRTGQRRRRRAAVKAWRQRIGGMTASKPGGQNFSVCGGRKRKPDDNRWDGERWEDGEKLKYIREVERERLMEGRREILVRKRF